MSNSFGISCDDLKGIVRERDVDGVARVEALEGIAGIAEKLNVDPWKGLLTDKDNFSKRVTSFGRNYVPPPNPRSYFSFLMDAFGDVTILVLCASAIVDLGLAFGYENTPSSYAQVCAMSFMDLFSFMVCFRVRPF